MAEKNKNLLEVILFNLIVPGLFLLLCNYLRENIEPLYEISLNYKLLFLIIIVFLWGWIAFGALVSIYKIIKSLK
jgi:hypothetical protein